MDASGPFGWKQFFLKAEIAEAYVQAVGLLHPWCAGYQWEITCKAKVPCRKSRQHAQMALTVHSLVKENWSPLVHGCRWQYIL